MTHYDALDILKNYLEEVVAGDKFPVQVQKGDTEQITREPEIHKMRLPHSNDAKKLAPYIIVRYVHSIDNQEIGKETKSKSVYRFIFCVYDDDESAGSLNLLNLMDRVKIRLLKDVTIAKRIKLDKTQGLEMFAYEDDTYPFYAGEIIMTFEYGPIEREVYDEKDYRNSFY